MTTNTNILTSPVAEIYFMAAENPVKDNKTGKENYSVRLAFDSKKDKEFLDKINEINDAKVVTSKTYRGKSKEIQAVLDSGKSLVEAKSQFKPNVYDSEGNQLEEAPLFFSGDTGTAQMLVQPYYGQKGGTINLVGIIVHKLENSNQQGDGTSRETRLAQLREAVQQATKG